MEKKIITKFTVATEQGMDALMMLTREIAMEKFSTILEAQELDKYVTDNFSKKNLLVEVNSMSNQWLAVYVDDQPAGYARITSKGKKPRQLDKKRSIRIADFGILKKYNDPVIRKSLFDKCMDVCKSYEAIWINEYPENASLEFFELEGFVRDEEIGQHDEIHFSSIYLIRQ